MGDAPTIVLRKRLPKAGSLKTEQAVNAARRQGVAVETQGKFGAGTNKHQATTLNAAKLDRETEELRHEKVPLEVGKLLQQARQAKGWSQKDLATRVNEKPQVVADYESGRALPNQAVIGKLERAVGIRLRGKERGQPLLPPAAKPPASASSSQSKGGRKK